VSLNGDSFLKEADKKLKGSFWDKIGFGNKSERYEDAVELCKKAANAFKLDKRWDDAAKAYLKCAYIEGLSK